MTPKTILIITFTTLLCALVTINEVGASQTLIFDITSDDDVKIKTAIREKHKEIDDSLGVPAGPIVINSDGRGLNRKYDNGFIYWSPETGAHAIIDGPIFEEWKALGSEDGDLGYPTTDLMLTSDELGWFCSFQGGIIFWKRNLGAKSITVLTSRPIIFVDKYFHGAWLDLRKSIGHLEDNNYETIWTGIKFNQKLKGIGFDDKVSSVFVPEGWSIIFYENEGYCGKHFTINGPAAISDLRRYTGGGFNDDISSVKVSNASKVRTGQFGELVINWAGVIDNKEGRDGLHGPYGNFHVLIYEASNPCHENMAKYPVPLKHVVLPGPNNTGQRCEWVDGDQMFYEKLSLFPWRSRGDSVKVFIYESDPSRTIPNFMGRKHDPVFCEVVTRNYNDPRVYMSKIPASSNAVVDAKNRAHFWIDRVNSIWRDGLVEGMPSMFLELDTVGDGVFTYNDRKP